MIFPAKPALIHADYEGYSASVRDLQERFLDYPRCVSIETLVKCNARCSFCPYPKSPRRGQVMTNKLFHKIVEELTDIPSNHPFQITLARINEPLLDSRIREFSDTIDEKLPSASQKFWTNGTMLKEGAFEWIARYPQACLSVSLNSLNEEEHIRMMGFGLVGVFRGLDYLNRLAESGKFNLPVELCAPFMNERQTMEYEDTCRKRWPMFKPVVQPFFQWMGGIDAGAKQRHETLLPDLDIKQAAGFPCGQWFDLHILANGYATKCCIDENGYVGEDNFDVRYCHVLDMYQESKRLREMLPGRSEIRDCESCLHLG